MQCPDVETLIVYALDSSGDSNAELSAHILNCPECRKNLEIIHETMLVGEWQNPSSEDECLLAACKARKFELTIDQEGNRISFTK